LFRINKNKINKNLKAFIPFACGFYDGENSYKYYLLDFNNYKKMLKKCIFDLAIPKYNDYTIYVHNGGEFDFIYLLNVLRNFNDKELIGSPKFTSKDGKIIGFDVKIHNHLYYTNSNKLNFTTLKFRDSYKLLPHSLRKLTKEFNVEAIKGDFPYLFPNINNLNYIGNFPDYFYFNSKDLSLKDYSSLKEQNPYNWNLKEECFKYLENDLKGLHQVLSIFNKFIYKNYKLNMTKTLSISSLAMKIYTSNYLKGNFNIPIISNRKVNFDIINALYGGRVEIFKPFIKKGYFYDVNSIYPAAMLMPMPVGSPIFSTNTNLKELFGIVFATVHVPDLADPVLPKRLLYGRLIFPKGRWSGWFFSEELKNAQFFGVKVEVHHSYIFEK